MRNSTSLMISMFGGLSGVMGVEHGIGAILQGNVTPSGFVYASWPESRFFAILSGEPAATVVPNLLVTGILAIVLSCAYLVWAVFLVERRHAGLALMAISVLMLPFGAGIFPPILGLLIGAAATQIHAPLGHWQRNISKGWRTTLGQLWPWTFGAGVLSWLAMVPGIPLLYYFGGIDNPALILVLLVCMFGFMILTAFLGFVRDCQKQVSLR